MKTLINKVSETHGISKKFAKEIISTVFTEIVNEVKATSRLALNWFGIFAVKQRSAKNWVNPRNPQEKIQIPAYKVLTFKASKSVKSIIS